MTSGDPLSAKNASGFFESDLLKKYATDFHRFSEAILARRFLQNWVAIPQWTL